MSGPLAELAQRVNDDFGAFYDELRLNYDLPPEAWAMLFVIAESIGELHRIVEESRR